METETIRVELRSLRLSGMIQWQGERSLPRADRSYGGGAGGGLEGGGSGAMRGCLDHLIEMEEERAGDKHVALSVMRLHTTTRVTRTALSRRTFGRTRSHGRDGSAGGPRRCRHGEDLKRGHSHY